LAAAAARKEELLQAIVDALGGTRMLALECDVSTWAVRAWLAGKHSPSPGNRRRIAMVARDFGLPSPYGEWRAGVWQERTSELPPAGVGDPESIAPQEAPEARELLSRLLEAAYGSSDDAHTAIERALLRAKRSRFPESVPEVIAFVRAGLVLVLSEDLGPRLTMTVLDDYIGKLEVRSGIRASKRDSPPSTPRRRAATPPRGAVQPRRLRVLLVDVDPVGRAALARALVRENCEVTSAGSLEELGQVIRTGEDLDVAVLDDLQPARLVVMQMIVDRFPAVSLVVRSAGIAATRTLLGALGVTRFEVLPGVTPAEALVDAILTVTTIPR
jgi:CheY-like chemotaxis protein